MIAGQNRPYAPDDKVHVSDAYASAVHSREMGSASKGLNADIDSALEQSAGLQSMPLADARERQVILRAVVGCNCCGAGSGDPGHGGEALRP